MKITALHELTETALKRNDVNKAVCQCVGF